LHKARIIRPHLTPPLRGNIRKGGGIIRGYLIILDSGLRRNDYSRQNWRIKPTGIKSQIPDSENRWGENAFQDYNFTALEILFGLAAEFKLN
jgi:hypothetical protein